jgi:hypothetical protein
MPAGNIPVYRKKGDGMNKTLTVLLIVSSLAAGPGRAAPIKFVEKPDRVDVLAGGMKLTSYIYGNDPNLELAEAGRLLTKPVLYPLYSPSGIKVTRCFPVEKAEDETTDHPHHTGLYFAYDEVGDEKGFWNNSKTPLPAIRHVRTVKKEGGRRSGTLSVILEWAGKDGSVVLQEERDMVFRAGNDRYVVDFSIDLTAKKDSVTFHDTKEGMFAVRVADWLRERGGTGRYLSSNGESTEKNVWGKRARWMRLQGQKDTKTIGVAILHHPSSVNFPTYWMARGYGLFSANPLGQYIYQRHHKYKDPQRLDLTLKKDQIAHFGFRVVVYEGDMPPEKLEKLYADFVEPE